MVEKEGDTPVKVIPGFIELEIAGEKKTGIRFIVER
jgi:stage V sporulation protein SpoVS